MSSTISLLELRMNNQSRLENAESHGVKSIIK
jgi:hypothetical protein